MAISIHGSDQSLFSHDVIREYKVGQIWLSPRSLLVRTRNLQTSTPPAGIRRRIKSKQESHLFGKFHFIRRKMEFISWPPNISMKQMVGARSDKLLGRSGVWG